MLLTETYTNISKVEENTLRRSGINATMNEVHLIVVVGRLNNPTISSVAAALGITTASVTVAVNKLIERGYLIKERNPEDGRSVCLSLARGGLRVYRLYDFYHRQMVRAVLNELGEEEIDIVCLGFERLNSFLMDTTEKKEQL